MTVSSQDTVFQYVANGVTTTFAYGCQVPTETDLVVYLNDVEQTSGYSTTGIGSLTGGTVIFSAAPASGTAVRIERDIELERTTDYQQNGDFLAGVVNPDFDRLWMALQGHLSGIRRAIKVPRSDTVAPIDLPTASQRANKILSFDAFGQPAVVAPAAQSATALQILLATVVGASLIGADDAAAGANYTTVAGFLSASRAPDGAKLFGFKQSGINAVARTMLLKARDTWHVRDTGVVGDNGTIDTVALQKVLDDLPNYTVLDFNGCICKVDGAVNLTGKTGVSLVNGGIHRDYSGGQTRCLVAKSCTDIEFYGMQFIGDNPASTTSLGEDDLLFVGDPVTTNPSTFNQGIEIHGCTFKGGRHGGINVYGNFGTSAQVKNTDVYIHHNRFDACTWGWFVYKNARRVTAEYNIVTNSGFGGFVCDTLASGDVSRLNTEPCYDIYFNNNIVDTTGLVAGAGARGGLIKGDITGYSMSGNAFRRIGTASSAADSFGWIIATDTNNGIPKQGEVNANIVDTVLSAGSGFIGIVSTGITDLSIDANIGANSPQGIQVEGAVRCSVKGNLLSNITTGIPIQVGAAATNGLLTKFSGVVSGNQITKFAGNASVPIAIGANTSRCHVGVNEVETFATAGVNRIFINASATGLTGERVVTSYASVAYDPPSIANGATNVATVNTLVGASFGDNVTVAFSADLLGLTYQGYMSAANTAKIVLTNNTGAAVDLASGTVYVTTERSTLKP